MTTYINFAPSPRSAFQFAPVLDGAARLAVVAWNVAGQRWYISLYDPQANNARVVTTPLIGSDDPLAISALSWDGVRQQVKVVTGSPHGIRIGEVADLTLSGATPAAYNGLARFTATNATTLVCPQTVDPGSATALGAIGRDIDLTIGSYASTLVYRVSARRFEVNP